MFKKKKILVIVLARSGSKTIKFKNLLKIKSVPLVGMVGKFVSKIKFIDKAIVSTDSIKIGRVARKYKLDFDFIRPKSLSGDIVSDFDVIEHGLKKIEKITGSKFDIIISLPPTSPLRKISIIKEGIVKLIKNKFDSVWTISKTDSKFHPLKQLKIINQRLFYYSKKGANIIARQQLSNIYHRNGAAYFMTRECILKKKKLITKNSSYLLIKEKQISIDNYEDLKEVIKFI